MPLPLLKHRIIVIISSVMRLAWIDKAKGVGMLLVILGHMHYPHSDLVSKFIFAFHMPLFFFLSGFLHKNNFGKEYVLRRIDALLVPYLIWSVVIWGVNSSWGRQYMGEFWDIPLGNGYGITWFLSCLFIVDVAGAYVAHLFGRCVIYMIVVGCGCVLLGNLHMIPVVECFNSALLAIGFWLIGWCYSKYKLVETIIKHFKWLMPLIFAIGMMYLFNTKVDIRVGRIGNPLIAYPVALSWIILLLLGVRFLGKRLSILDFIGRNSLLFMVVHWICPIVVIAMLGMFGMDVASVGGILKAMIRVLNLVFLFVLVVMLSKVPFLTGRYRLASLTRSDSMEKRS